MRSSACLTAIVLMFGLGTLLPAQSPSPPGAPTPPHGELSTDVAPQSVPVPGQRERPLFRSGVELIQLDVSVLDQHRHPVLDLTPADFTVFENGVQRPVRSFNSVQLPGRRQDVDAALAAVLRGDVATNQVGQQDGRLVIILMDRSIPVGQPTLVARKIATAAVDALGPGDLAALVSTSGGVPHNLTADRARLLAAINQRDWSTGISSEQEAIIGRLDPLSDPRCLCGLCVLEAVTNVSDALRDAPRRRKVLFFIGSSLILQAGPRAPSADVGCGRRVEDARRRLFDSLALSGLTVHSLDPSGLVTHTSAGAGGGKPGGNAAQRRQVLQTDISNLLSDTGSLQVLPDLTGGRAVLNTNGPEEKVPDIFRESDAYYVLAFEPATSDLAPQSRSIDVKVARRGVQVHARRRIMLEPAVTASSGIPGAPNAPGSLEKALRGLLPDASRPLTLAVAAFAGSDNPKATLIINVDAGSFANASAAAMPLAFAVSIVDRTGRQVASGQEVATIMFQPGTSDRAETNVQTLLELIPGDYEVRVAVSDPATGVVASVFREVASR